MESGFSNCALLINGLVLSCLLLSCLVCLIFGHDRSFLKWICVFIYIAKAALIFCLVYEHFNYNPNGKWTCRKKFSLGLTLLLLRSGPCIDQTFYLR